MVRGVRVCGGTGIVVNFPLWLPPLLSDEEAEYAAELVWMFRRREKSHVGI